MSGLTASGGAIDLNQVQTTGSQIYSGATTLRGNLTSTGAGSIAVDGAAILGTNLTVTTASGAVVFGGHNDIDGALDTIEIYDSVTGTWSYDTTVMDDERYGHTVTRLNDGTYLIAGGHDNAGNPLETWEIWQR